MLGTLLLLSIAVFAQSTYYWADGQQIPLQADPSSVVIYFHDGAPLSGLLTGGDLEGQVSLHHRRAVIQSSSRAPLKMAKVQADLGIKDAQVRSMSHGFQLEDGFNMWLTHRVVLQLAKGKELADIHRLMRTYGATLERKSPHNILLDVADIAEVLPLANALQESGLVKWATPDIYAPLTMDMDPLFGQQFQMNNTGQTIDGFPGANDADCNAPQAWSITKGSSSIIVAVIDDGVEAHEDLVTGGGASRVLNGFTPVNNGNGTPNASGRHGEACAGIIAASHNGIGVQGVAPNVRILPVNIFQGGESTQDLADAINFARTNGADVLSNSWGYNSCSFSASNLTNAINTAASSGRGGKGCVVAFSSGNSYGTCVNYPARLASVIAVGAFGNDGIISDYSNEGPTLDIVAPSNDVSSAGFLSGAGVRTIDRMGGAGYTSGNYTPNFGGTSASCPIVAGVAALVLSVNASLTDEQVKSILYNSAIDMGSGGFDNTYGHGRVNAFGAVQAAGGGGGGSNPIVTMRKGNALNFAIDGNNGGGNGQNVYLWSYNPNNVNQRWIEIDRGGGYFSYQKQNTNFCLDGGNGGGNGQNVYLWTCGTNNQNQHWRKVNLGGGKFRLEKRNAPAYSIDGNNGGANGQNLYLWSSNNGNGNQQWQFATVGSSNRVKQTEIQQLSARINPNPLRGDKLAVTLELPDAAPVHIQLFDMAGRRVFATELAEKPAGAHQLNLSRREMGIAVAGIYLVQLKSGSHFFQTKLIVE
ncbi:MAG: S8 family serine peptidase [Bacteroidota bacterium]